MIRESITIDDALEVLNRAVQADPQAMWNLCESRVPCNEILAEDPSIQVAVRVEGDHTVGLIGILNGLFGEQDGWGPICVSYEVVCSKDHSHDSGLSLRISEACPVCGSELILGRILGFVRTSSSVQ